MVVRQFLANGVSSFNPFHLAKEQGILSFRRNVRCKVSFNPFHLAKEQGILTNTTIDGNSGKFQSLSSRKGAGNKIDRSIMDQYLSFNPFHLAKEQGIVIAILYHAIKQRFNPFHLAKEQGTYSQLTRSTGIGCFNPFHLAKEQGT